MLTFYFKEC